MADGAGAERIEPDLIDPDTLDFGESVTRAAAAGAPAEPEVLDADSLDFGLGVAFAPAGKRTGEGVAAAIDRMTGGGPRVLLPDDGDGPSPMLRVVPGGSDRLGDDGRYESLGEIARGGLGIVLKGRDRDLGRDVAIKVLRPEFAKNDAVLARFVEEAQIGGQLQHPGLVPVYSLGMGEGGRPFFAMKLVKGRTLASLLVDRKSPKEGLRRHLATFESVCRTMAYAHSRRVVHRDLKPSNIMLGAFGEVQVVDWGLAKVLGRGDVPGVRPAAAADPDISLIATVRTGSAGSGSLAGSVLGTPGYLSPEQALGRLDDVDERTDVFALGSILCEILTGEPPFTGDARDQILLAARGNLDDATARLAKCGAGPALVDIAKKCLASDRGGRFRDAGVLADAVTAHLSGAEARARQAELAAAEARAKAEEARTLAARERSTVARERAAQRRTIALSAVGLCAVAGAIVVWRNQAAGESDRAARAVAAVSDALADANARRGAKDMVGAVASAQKAAALAKSGQVDAETTDRAAKLLAEVQTEDQAARAAALQAAKDEAFAAAIGRAYGSWETDEDAAHATADCFAAFRDYGVDLEKCDVEAGAALLRASPNLAEMAAVLDDWTRDSRRRRPDHPAAPEADALIGRVERIVRSADPDPWRSRLRDAMKDGEAGSDVLRALVDAPEMEAQPDRTLDELTVACKRRGDEEAALKLGRVQERRHPGRPWLAMGSMMSMSLDENGKNRLDRDEVSAAWTARLALHPSVDRWQNLGNVLTWSNEPMAAVAAYEEAARLNPGSYSACVSLMESLNSESGEFDSRLKEVADRAAKLDPKRGEAWFHGGDVLLRAREFEKAEASYRKSLALMPDNALAHVGLAGVVAHAGKFDEFFAELRTAARLIPSAANVPSFVIDRLTSTRVGDAEGAIAEANQAFELFPNDPRIARVYVFALQVEAISAVNAGDKARALALLDGAMRLHRKRLAIAPKDAEAHCELGHALALRAHIDGTACPEAIDEYRESIRLEPHPRAPDAYRAHDRLADELYRVGRYDEARAEYARALRLFPFSSEVIRSFAWLVLQLDGDYAQAIRLMRQAVDAAPDELEARFSLIGAMNASLSGPPETRASVEQIETERKRLAETLARPGRAKSEWDDEETSELEARVVALMNDPQFPERVRRGVMPSDRFDAFQLAFACIHLRLRAGVASIAAQGLAATCKPHGKPDRDAWLRSRLLYMGACQAALAADGDGQDAETLDPAARARLRRQAFDWLREACALNAPAGVGADSGSAESRNLLCAASIDTDFASVRDPVALERLPPDDRAAWERLWAEVDRAARSFSERSRGRK